MGYVDSDGPCERGFQSSEVIDKGFAYISRVEFFKIIKFLKTLDTSTHAVGSTYGMCMQSNFHFAADSSKRVCIGQFGDMTIENKSFARSDSLVYLLRKYAGFYNYYPKEDLVGFCKELSQFPIPEDYHDTSGELASADVFFAKFRILAK
ncbi:hypothetical protein [Sphingobacterium sp. MYb382]|uniref:hypothetical protein n=1 Tax=Sphingobacterium sp. MYb382 TaxID=2745278 RepID=UPI0030B4E391